MHPFAFVHNVLDHSNEAASLLSVDRQPSDTEAATYLGIMDLSTGRPTISFGDLHAAQQQCPHYSVFMALPNVGNEGRFAMIFLEYEHPERGISVLLAKGPMLSSDQGFFHIVPQNPHIPLVFSPQVYRMTDPRVQGFTRPYKGGTEWREAPGPHRGDLYTQFVRDANRALDAAERLPPVVAPHLGDAHTLVASWAFQNHQPARLEAILRGVLFCTDTIKWGIVAIFGGTVTDTGKVAPACLRLGSDRTWGRVWDFDHTRIKTLDAWFQDRLQAAGCPWQPHQLVAQTHTFAKNHHQSYMFPASRRQGGLLVDIDVATLRNKDLSTHERLQHHHHHQDIMAW